MGIVQSPKGGLNGINHLEYAHCRHRKVRSDLKKKIRRVLLPVFVFILALAGFTVYQYLSEKEPEHYEAMSAATLPLVRLHYGSSFSNELHGYTQPMELAAMRDTITPLDADHKVRIVISHAQKVSAVSYEVRGLDGKRLVENGVIENWNTDGQVMETTLQLSSLVEDKEEYQLILKLTQQEREICYYTRVIYLENGNTEQLLAFPGSFIQASVNGDTSFIVNYIQPDDSMANDTFAYVNQHSRSGMITWKGLNAAIQGEVKTTLTELSDSQAAITVQYPICLTAAETTLNCNVQEEYVVRWRGEVLYLLSFDRYVKEVFSASQVRFDEGSIWLGITQEEPVQMKSPDGRYHVYLYDDQLFSYYEKEHRMEMIYTYRDGEDPRSSWDHHSMQVIQVDDAGNVYFMVYGYHNRGHHEGEVGVSLLQYVQEGRKLDEILYIPVSFSEQMLMENMGALAYVNQDSDLLYLLYGSTVYSIDLSSGEKVELAASSSAGSFYTDAGSRLLSWEEGNGVYADTIRVVDLSNGQNYAIEAPQGEYLQIQGFLNQDLVYGIGRRSDTLIQSGQAVVMPLYALRFASFGEGPEQGMEQAGEYAPAGVYISKVQLQDNALKVERVVKTAAGYEQTAEDYVFFNYRDTDGETASIRTKQLEGFLQVSLMRGAIDPNGLVIESSTGQLSSSDSAYQLNLTDLSRESSYYVYAGGRLCRITASLQEAIALAYSEMGCVLDSRNAYVWTRGTRDLNKTIPVDERLAESGNSLCTAIEILISAESAAYGSVEALLTDGKAPDAVIEAVMAQQNRQGRVLSLKGCTVGQILYYMHRNHPVLAVTGSQSAVLLTAYDSRNVVIYDPATGEKTTMSQAEAESYFAQYGNDFICWNE